MARLRLRLFEEGQMSAVWSARMTYWGMAFGSLRWTEPIIAPAVVAVQGPSSCAPGRGALVNHPKG